jgi:AcrR family transcriptional regulator
VVKKQAMSRDSARAIADSSPAILKQENSMSDLEIKQRIHSKALDHFLQFGFSKVTMNEIAEELGMSKKTLYHYFPGKEELLAEVLHKLQDETASELESIVQSNEIDFVQKLRGSLNILASFHAKLTPYFMADLEKHAPEVCKYSNDFSRDRIRTIMSGLLAEGVQKGMFRNDVDPALIVRIYAGALQHLLRPDTFTRLALSVTEVHRVISKVLIEGILTDEARKKMSSASRELSAA